MDWPDYPLDTRIFLGGPPQALMSCFMSYTGVMAKVRAVLSEMPRYLVPTKQSYWPFSQQFSNLNMRLNHMEGLLLGATPRVSDSVGVG